MASPGWPRHPRRSGFEKVNIFHRGGLPEFIGVWRVSGSVGLNLISQYALLQPRQARPMPRYGLDPQIFKQRQEVLEYKRQMGTRKARRQAGAGLQNAAGASSVLCIRLVDLVGED